MSRKNHVRVDGKLLQTDKSFSSLKMKQKDKIAEWEYRQVVSFYEKNGRYPTEKDNDEVVDAIYEKIEAAGIWIPYYEIESHYSKRRQKLVDRAEKLRFEQTHRIEKVIFMNMCMVYDDAGNVVALDKVGKNYSGTTFPGGHVEEGETFAESVIREIYEETGLTIRNPKLTGVYHWMTGDIRNVGYLYKTNEFEGELKSSEEGKVYWISGEEFLKKPLGVGMLQVWELMHADCAGECLQTLMPDGTIVSKIQ